MGRVETTWGGELGEGGVDGMYGGGVRGGTAARRSRGHRWSAAVDNSVIVRRAR